ncbi:DUF6701 domain-containing protein [endosymbiont of unidentified scaly snail isolate Monju]|uniref:DUF6701 domain-containing protein n=1 Tax=endosymbiont of unidentified scaly snail isolate Monju TaxID=1248727 RepID=UPI0003892AC0|nr:DUF6701 domain-containing protein [endosymbiont of unidentified scaly snail isolate Monju]BAN70141.1 MSHA biogenesis protein MshQ [endosymbiont of unidentified scaly snail isolate Monju]
MKTCLLGLLCFLSLSLRLAQADAGSCALLWPSGLQNTSDEGKIEFKDQGQLLGDPDGLLDTGKVKNKGNVPSCGNTDCQASGSLAPAPAAAAFQRSSSKRKINVPDDGSFRLGSDGYVDYKEVMVDKRARLDVDASFTRYRIRKLKLEKESVLVLRAGVDYWIEELDAREKARILVEGEGTARLYVRDKLTLEKDVLINSPSAASGGDPARLFILAYNKIELEERVTVSAFLHGGDKVKLDKQVQWFGAISAQDDIKVKGQVSYDASALADLDVPGICTGGSTPPSDGADGFNCVQPGQDALAGRLFTRLAGSDFSLDVIALRDSDGDGLADAVASDYAAEGDRSVRVELVDASSGGACSSLPTITGSAQTLVFRAADGGRVRSHAFRVDRAWRSVRCRVRDDSGDAPVVACSADRFAVRPRGFVLDSPTLNNATASGSNFRYDEVGAFRFRSGAIRDSGFTAVDSGGDCLVGSSTTQADATGRIGCDIANADPSAWIGRFVPASFVVSVSDPGRLANSCGSFSYIGQAIGYDLPPSLRIEARNRAGTITRNYTGDYMKLDTTGLSFVDPVADASAIGADGSTPLALAMQAGSRVLVDNGDGSLTLSLVGDRFTYAHDALAQIAPFTSDIRLVLQSVTDTDGATSGRIDLAIAPTGVPLRYGRLALGNAEGSELQTLAVPARVEYFAGSALGFLANVDDHCTPVGSMVIEEVDAGDSLAPADTCVWDSAGLSGAAACADPGESAWQLRATPDQADFNLHLAPPGVNHTGVLRLRMVAPAWLRYDWSGVGDADPAALINFGIRGSSSDIIYLRQQ